MNKSDIKSMQLRELVELQTAVTAELQARRDQLKSDLALASGKAGKPRKPRSEKNGRRAHDDKPGADRNTAIGSEGGTTI